MNNSTYGFAFMNINNRISLLMDAKRLKQKEFAELTGVLESSFSTMLSGKTGVSFKLINGIANNFKDVDIEWLLTGEGEMLKKNYVNEGNHGYHIETDIKTQKVVELYQSLNETQQREIFSALEDKKQLNEMKSKVDFLISHLPDYQDQQMTA